MQSDLNLDWARIMSGDELQQIVLPPEIDPELDMRSEQFNPLKALYAQRAPRLVEHARVYDNLAQFEPIFRREFCRHPKPAEPPVHKKSTGATSSKQLRAPADGVPTARRFTAEQQPIAARPRSNRHTRNILSRMTDATKLQGPRQMLRIWREQRTLVKVSTRNEKGVDGHVIGYIEAFDKHWNLVVSSAQQAIEQRKKRYSFRAAPADGQGDGDEGSAEAECLRRLASLKIDVPAVKYVASHGRRVTCLRSVPQLMVRGEHVVTIATIATEGAKP